VLDGLGRARKVPIACKGSILGLGTPSLLRHKYNKPTVWQFQRKEVTSVSDRCEPVLAKDKRKSYLF
jgi:hypothetical protein